MIVPVATAMPCKAGALITPLALSNLIREVDLRQLPVQALPQTVAGLQLAMAGKFPSPPPAASGIVAFDDETGSYNDSVQAVSLAPTGTILRGRRAVGLSDGSASRWHPCAEFRYNVGGVLTASSNSAYQIDVVSTANTGGILVVFRTTRESGVQRTIVEKWTGSVGWRLRLEPSGLVRFTVADSNAVSGSVTATVGSHEGWHVVFCRWNKTSGQLEIRSDLGQVNQAVAYTGVSTTTAFMKVGDASDPAPVQVAYLAHFAGAAAEAVTQGQIDQFWRHGKLAALSTYTRAGQAAHTVMVDGTGERVGCWASGQVAQAYAPLFGDIGLAAHGSCQNLLTHSYLDAWLVVNGGNNGSINAADSPSGARNANLLTTSGATGRVYSQFSATNGQTYTFSVWLRADTPHRARLQYYTDGGGSTVNTSVAFNIGTTWKRYFIDFTATATTTQSVGIEVDTDGTNLPVQAYGGQVRTGNSPGPLVHTTGTTQTCPATTAKVTLATTDVPGAQGALEVEFQTLRDSQTTTRYVCDVRNEGGASDSNRRVIRLDTAANLSHVLFEGWNNAAAHTLDAAQNVQNFPAQRQQRWRAQWRMTPGFWNLVDKDAAVAYSGTGTFISSANSTDTLFVGSDRSIANHLEGVIRTIRSFAAVE